MQQLLSDPQTIPFVHNSSINLICLKQQINRRMDKIRALLTGPHIDYNIVKNDFACQTETETLLDNERQQGGKLKHRRALSTFDINVQKEDDKTCQERPSLPNKQQKKFPQVENYNKRTRLSDYLTKNMEKEFQFSNLIARQISEKSIKKSIMNNKQDENIFTSLEFTLRDSLRTSQNKKSKEGVPPHFEITAKHIQSQSLSPLFKQDADQQEGRKSTSTINRRQLSIRKVKFTERTNQTENQGVRIIVSDECRSQMLSDIEKIISRKRREPIDNKLRVNIIKKIDEKYGDYYDNI